MEEAAVRERESEKKRNKIIVYGNIKVRTPNDIYHPVSLQDNHPDDILIVYTNQ